MIQNDNDLLLQFRNVFGDEQQDYNKTLKRYYAEGAPSDWQQRNVSAYASAHPWEDWAESWAHYLHMFDTLETARAWGLSMKYKKGRKLKMVNLDVHSQSFEEMKEQWLSLTASLNSLNRSMGMKDVYPFVWSGPVLEKLGFIQQIINRFKQGVYQ